VERTSLSSCAIVVISFSAVSLTILTGSSTAFDSSSAGQASGHGTSVTTYHNDNSRSGANTAESVLAPLNVNAEQFGKVFSYSVDGDVYAQPLYLANVSVAGKGVRNVVYVATENDSVYAFDADGKDGASSLPLWHASFVNPAAGITAASNLDVTCNDISSSVGITGTPVLDANSGTLYVVAKTKENGVFVQRLHALDVTSGIEKFGGPVVIHAQVKGSGQGAKGGTIHFDPRRASQRAGLLLQNGLVYVAWDSHCDQTTNHGWVIAFDASTLSITGVWNSTPNGKGGGIWQSGGGPAADSEGNVYFATGNGDFTANTGGQEFGESIVKLRPPSHGTMAVADYFTPDNEATLNAPESDLGSGGVLLLPSLPPDSPHQHLLVQSGNEGTIYLIDRDNMGKFSATNDVVQALPGAVGAVLSTPGWWDSSAYFAAGADVLKAYSLNSSTGLLATVPSSESVTRFNSPGAIPSISANGKTQGIVWVVQTDQISSGGPAILHAYDASNLANELYNSSQNQARDNPGAAVVSSVPTVVNGKVYVGTRGQVSVYGLLGSPTPSGGISFVQVAAATPRTPMSSVSVTYPSAQTAGNLNVVVVGWNDTTSSVQSVTDSHGNTYALATPMIRGTNLSEAIYYLKNIASGTNTVTATFNQAAAFVDMRVLEYSGLDQTSPLDVVSSSSGSSAVANSGSATTTASNELIFGADTVFTGNAAPGPNFTVRIITSPDSNLAEDRIVATAGSYNARATLTSSGPWVMQMATFKAPGTISNPPTVLSVSPSSGSDDGGTNVTVTGTNFASGASVTFGGTVASNTVVVNSTTLTATTLPHSAGTVTVVVTNPNGQSGSLNSGYTYTANPTITSVSPSTGSVSGGTSVTITGTNFVSGATVTFGGTGATNVVFVNSTSLTATTPAHAAGGVNVVVTDSNNLSGTLANGFIYNASVSTIGFVQVAAATPRTPQSSVSVTYPSAQTAGDLNVVVVGWNDTTSSVKSVTDSHGNTYALAAPTVRGTNLSQAIYYLKNIPSGANTVTATFNQAAAFVDMRVLEYSGADPANPFDASAAATGNSKTASSGSAPTNAGNELVVAADTVFTGNLGPGPGFTKRIITLPDSNLVEDKIVSTPGTYVGTAPLTGSGPWVMQMVTFMSVQQPASGPLQVSNSNSRYFMDGSGNPLYLTGAHNWADNKDGWGIPGTCPPPQFDWTGYLNYVQGHRYNWIRLWTWELPTSLSEPYPGSTECHLPLPFLRTGPGFATDGGLEFDLNQFDQSYFDRLRQRVIDARQRGIYVSIMLFDGHGLNGNGVVMNSTGDRIANDGYWFTGANNINGVDDGFTVPGTFGAHSQDLSRPAITNIQNAYVQKVIDTVNDLDNVMYEIANEPGQSYSTTWETNLIAFIHNYEAGKKKHPVGFTCQFPNNGNPDPTYFQSSADWVAPCASGYGWNPNDGNNGVTETSTGNKVVIDDTDHAWYWKDILTDMKSDPTAMRQWVWENFTRGANTAFMDPYLTVYPGRNNPSGGNVDPQWNMIRVAMTQTATYSRQIDLAQMTPHDSLCTSCLPNTTYCLANVGQQYLIYAPAGGAFTMTLSPGTYYYEWFNPGTSTVAATGSITVGSSQTFTSPFSGDAVLVLRIQ